MRGKAFFHNLAHITGKTEQIFMKILPEMSLHMKVSIKFRSHHDPPDRYGEGLHSPSYIFVVLFSILCRYILVISVCEHD